MSDNSERLTLEQLSQAFDVAQDLADAFNANRKAGDIHNLRDASVTMAERAVYIHGVEAWVCPQCFKTTSVANRLPMAPASCTHCGWLLQR